MFHENVNLTSTLKVKPKTQVTKLRTFYCKFRHQFFFHPWQPKHQQLRPLSTIIYCINLYSYNSISQDIQNMYFVSQ